MPTPFSPAVMDFSLLCLDVASFLLYGENLHVRIYAKTRSPTYRKVEAEEGKNFLAVLARADGTIDTLEIHTKIFR
jgi:hypothetical protein